MDINTNNYNINNNNRDNEDRLNNTIYSLIKEAYYENIKTNLIEIQSANLINNDEKIKYIIDNIQACELLLDVTQYGYSFTNDPREDHQIFLVLIDHVNMYRDLLTSLEENYHQQVWFSKFSELVKSYIEQHRNFILKLVNYCKSGNIDNDLFKERPFVITEDLTSYEANSLSDAYSISSYDKDVFQCRRINEYGTPFVIGSDKDDVFFKIDNESHLLSPLKEFGVFQFYKLLFTTPCIPPVQLLVMKNLPILPQQARFDFSKSEISRINNNRPVEDLLREYPIVRTILESKLEKENYFIQGSTFIKGNIFNRFLEEFNNQPLSEFQYACSSRLDLESFSSHVISSLLLVPMDFKSGYLIIENRTKRIYSIENDRSFESEIKLNPKTNDWILGTRNVLYLIEPLMSKYVPERVRDEFLKVQPNLLLLEWLSTMKEKEEVYLKLINIYLRSNSYNNNEEELSRSLRNLKSHLHLPQTFSRGWITSILGKFKLIKDQLKKNMQSTHQELFEIIHPVASLFYKLIADKYPNDRLEQYSHIFKKYSLKSLLTPDLIIKVENTIKENNMIPSTAPQQLSIFETIEELISATEYNQFDSHSNEDLNKWITLVTQHMNKMPQDKKKSFKLHSSWNSLIK